MKLRATLGNLATAIAVSTLSLSSVMAATSQVVVTPGDISPSNWYFYDDTADAAHFTQLPGTYEFATNPAGSQGLGKSSIKLTDNTNSDRWDINTLKYGGTALNNIKRLEFMTYQPSTNPGDVHNSIYLNFDVDFHAAVPGYQGRLVYVPAANGTVVQNAWQTWKTIPGLWNWSHYSANGNKWPDGVTTPNRSWSDIVTAFPSASILKNGQLVLRAGQPGPTGFVGYTDGVRVQVGRDTTRYNFELAKPKDSNGGSDNEREDDTSQIVTSQF